MSKVVKRIYLPSGLLVSMYNLYSGKGENEILNMYDVELMCSFLEYYFNYTEEDKKNYIYRFYTLPHFYTSKKNMVQDEELLKRDRALRDRYGDAIREDDSLNRIANELTQEKVKILNNRYGASDGRPKNPYSMGVSLGADAFRLSDLYAKGLFSTTLASDMATFYLLKNKNAKANMGSMQFSANEAEIKSFLNDYFMSSSYKAVEEIEGKDVSSHFAPEVDIFIDCFKKAAADYSHLGFDELNKKYSKEVETVAQGMVDIEITS